MFFVLHAFDKAGALETRLAHYDAHKAFLAETSMHGVSMVMSGPLVADDGKTMIGSLMILEAPDRATLEAFNRADPFYAARIWEKIDITAFVKRQG
ncbi:MAG: uncharacterized protein QOH65_2995 [Methylobacteriaceae bacterium]|jgi:uncharacterized protein YciI|nr:uncharacterized protein [Methylobacteriaceae bacterium]